MSKEQTVFQKLTTAEQKLFQVELELRDLKNASGFLEMEFAAAQTELVEARNKIAELEYNQVLMQKIRDRQEAMIVNLRDQIAPRLAPVEFQPCCARVLRLTSLSRITEKIFNRQNCECGAVWIYDFEFKKWGRVL